MKTEDTDRICEVKFTVPFHDLDPMEVVWHGNYFKYFDITRDALFRKMGVDLYRVYTDTQHIFPIIRTSIKHVFPLRFRDEFVCRAKLTAVDYKIGVDFIIRLTQDSRVIAKGKSQQAAVKIPEMETLFKIPDTIRHALGFE
ncbi:MAG: acyl-CoA thioesterase [Desulfobacteraceae bacterium]|nr:acyl-CoA thioesterase [Desulfobacteraceae bacterium]